MAESEFEELFNLADKCSRQLSRFISYLESQPSRRGIREAINEYQIEAVE